MRALRVQWQSNHSDHLLDVHAHVSADGGTVGIGSQSVDVSAALGLNPTDEFDEVQLHDDRRSERIHAGLAESKASVDVHSVCILS